jgi:hypothetical protein
MPFDATVPMILVFSDQSSSRLIYTLNFIFNARGLHYELTDHKDTFIASQQQKFNYSHQTFDGIPQIIPCGLLNEQGIVSLALQKTAFRNLEILSFNQTPDILASIFFVLSRYEEYWQTERDAHNRYPAASSIQHQFGWLKEPICDRWALSLLDFIGINPPTSVEFKVQPTFDIDAAFAFEGKGLFRNGAGILKNLLKGQFSRVRERLKVIIGKNKDPFDTFDRIIDVARNYPETRIFWLLADYSAFNKNLHPTHPKQTSLIKSLSNQITIGIHPGYDSYRNKTAFESEKNRLEELIEKTVIYSRQHYLRLSLPDTYNILLEHKIDMDFTMGYAETTGFRMGTARSVPWYNLHENQISTLQLQPFCYMDGTLNEYLKMPPQQAIEEVKRLKELVRSYGGTFSFIWHNETLGFQNHWRGWEGVFEASLDH